MLQGGFIKGEVVDQDVAVFHSNLFVEASLSCLKSLDELLAELHALIEVLVTWARHGENVTGNIDRSNLPFDGLFNLCCIGGLDDVDLLK